MNTPAYFDIIFHRMSLFQKKHVRLLVDKLKVKY